MASGISKSAWVCLVLGVTVACGGEDPGDTNGTAGASSIGGSSMAGSAGSGGSPAAAGTATVGGSAGAAGNATGGAGAGGGGAAGAPQAGMSGGGAGGAGGAGGSGGAGGAGGNAGGGAAGAAPFVLSSPVLDRHDDCTRDAKASCDTFETTNVLQTIGGENQSPELDWTAGPAGTQSYAIGLHDLSNGANGYTHWVVWNIPAATLELPANLQRKAMLDMPAGARQSSFNDDNAYAGPGAHGNVYEFKVYALKTATLNVNNPDDQAAIRKQLEQSQDVLATSALRAKSP